MPNLPPMDRQKHGTLDFSDLNSEWGPTGAPPGLPRATDGWEDFPKVE